MKTIVLGLLLMGITGLSTAQNEIAYVDVNDASFKEIPLKPDFNLDYLQSVKLNAIPDRVRAFQNIVAGFDITKSAVYTKANATTYVVTFKEGKNTIKAVYDANGTIIECDENFESVRVPYSLSKELLKDYPGWGYDKVWLSISYKRTDVPVIQYKVVLKNGNKEKTISIDATDFI